MLPFQKSGKTSLREDTCLKAGNDPKRDVSKTRLLSLIRRVSLLFSLCSEGSISSPFCAQFSLVSLFAFQYFVRYRFHWLPLAQLRWEIKYFLLFTCHMIYWFNLPLFLFPLLLTSQFRYQLLWRLLTSPSGIVWH